MPGSTFNGEAFVSKILHDLEGSDLSEKEKPYFASWIA